MDMKNLKRFDKLAFMDALLDRQFLGVKPTDLKGIAKFAYISQTNSIDSQVKGYETKTKSKLVDSVEIEGGTHTPTVGGSDTPTVQVQVQVQEKGEVEQAIDLIYSLYPTKCKTRNSSTGKTEKNKDQIKKLLKTYSVDKISNIIKRYTLESDKDKVYMKNFGTFLNNLPDYESKEVDVFELEDKYIYFQWKNDATATARRTPREGATKMFENQAKGGYTPVFLESIKGKNITWKQ